MKTILILGFIIVTCAVTEVDKEQWRLIHYQNKRIDSLGIVIDSMQYAKFQPLLDHSKIPNKACTK